MLAAGHLWSLSLIVHPYSVVQRIEAKMSDGCGVLAVAHGIK